MEKVNITDLTMDQLRSFLEEMGEQPFRAKQIFSWIYKGVDQFEEMTNLSKTLREKLEEQAHFGSMEIIRVLKSKNDGTRKYLFRLEDGNIIESVFMKYKYGNSICISSQAGCRMGCHFCASGLDGLRRGLTPGEMVGQILTTEKDTGEKINHVVVMGTGEPFDNYENLLSFLKNIHEKEGLGISLRNMTVSTCGMIPQIKAFAKEMKQVNLAVSLHSADDVLRSSMMPVNKKYPVDQLIDTCREYGRQTGRRVTFEYALVKGKTDTKEQIDILAKKLKGMLCHVNLIPLNEVKETDLSASSRKRAAEIAQYLEKQGVPTTIRRELGADIQAACGQLRLGELQK